MGMCVPSALQSFVRGACMASLVLAFLLPGAASAANLGTLQSVSNVGVVITNSSFVYRSDFSSASTFWTFTFSVDTKSPHDKKVLSL